MNQTFLKVLLLLSVFFSAIAVLWIITRTVRLLFGKNNPNSRIVWYLLLFVASIWCLRYSVGYYSVFNDGIGLTKYEEIFNSLVHTFQSFSMDEDYTQYISTGKDMIKCLFGENTKWIAVYGLYASVLNVLAPICGGAILLDILQGVFPGVKLFFKKLAFWKIKYYFSELNDRSLACAKSILKQNYRIFCRPIIVFTDVYTDGENEKSSELLKKAKAIGGICMNDDLTHINHRFTSKKEYWLIDENEIDNIKTLAEFSNEKHYKSIKKTVIRIFYQDDSYTLTEAGIVGGIREQYEKEIFKKNKSGNLRLIIRLRSKIKQIKVLSEKIKPSEKTDNNVKLKRQGNIRMFFDCKLKLDVQIDKLLDEYFEILKKKDNGIEKSEVFKTIEERVKNIFIDKKAPAIIRTRCYQNLIYGLLKEEPLYMPLVDCENSKSLDVAILGNGYIGTEMFLSTYWCGQMHDVSLSINIVSQDETEVAEAKINRISNEILETAKVKSSLLKVYEDVDEYNEPYFTYRYCKSNVDFDDVSQIKCLNPFGKSDDNMLLINADYLMVALGDDAVNIRVAERLLKAIMIHQKETGCHKKVTIAYVVYDSHLCRTLNEYHKNGFKDEYINIRAVGSIDDVYSYENIVNKKYMRAKLNIDKDKKDLSYKDWIKLSNMMAVSGKPYEFWSTYARDIHHEYKVFSAFVSKERNICEWEKWKQDCSKSKCICKGKDELADQLAWAEHRRWNAYMRSIGFKHNENKDVIFLKTHDCLVEHHKSWENPASVPKGSKDFLEKVKEKKDKHNIINYDYEGIIPKAIFEELIDKTNQEYQKGD